MPFDSPRIATIIPVLNEEESLPLVLADIPPDRVETVFVVDNGCTDRSPEVAREHGAVVIDEPRRGYGSACLAGIAAAEGFDVLVFLDGDYSDHPDEMTMLLEPVLAGEADFVVGSRMLRSESKKALLPQSRFGNWLASVMMRVLFGIRCSDLGPFRVITKNALDRLGMQDRDFGWTVEMQLRAKLAGLRVRELPVSYRKRVGVSKITGTLSGTIKASYKIIKTILAYRIRPPRLGS